MVLDLLSTLSLVLHFVFVEKGINSFEGLHMLRFLNLFRMERNFQMGRRVMTIFWHKHVELICAFSIAVVLTVVASALMYYIESPVNANFATIPESMWWATSALTSVGYGDVVPKTRLGKLVGSIVAFVGVWFFALPTGIIAAGVEETVEEPYTMSCFEARVNNRLDKMQSDMTSIQQRLLVLSEAHSTGALEKIQAEMALMQQRLLVLLEAQGKHCSSSVTPLNETTAPETE
eukprot:gnl/TRDRNA2_/TRDRNA2_204463_c0_seq1.p1 gnl/TRDRNA2_/TRDRNA2_204463_c0~~gnl/TRDRNA2_/TRDRNA2_204463_c0_seq1.p1  ORF type:complete len:252 (+),score=45.27 gnl/TRDRNA2_/TRDRNA2_204463_c0_seq1:58-756(+)